jgi:hypothetical protein
MQHYPPAHSADSVDPAVLAAHVPALVLVPAHDPNLGYLAGQAQV